MYLPDIKKSFQGLEKAFKYSTGALIMAAQEQTLSIRSIEAAVYCGHQDSCCRLLKGEQHIIAGF